MKGWKDVRMERCKDGIMKGRKGGRMEVGEEEWKLGRKK